MGRWRAHGTLGMSLPRWAKRMSEQRLNERIEDYQRATHQLAKAVARPMDEFMRDSVIQRFKVA